MTCLKSLTHFSGWLEWCARVLRSKYGVLWCDVPRCTLLLLGVLLQKWCTSHLVCKAHHNFYSEITVVACQCSPQDLKKGIVGGRGRH